MSGFGRFNCWPFQFGGATRPIETEYNALREALAPNRQGYNVDDDLIDAENYAHAMALSQIWAANKRSANQAIPSRMLEELPREEEILRLKPAPTDTDLDRRSSVAAKRRGLAGNAMPDIEATCRAVLGANYVEVHRVEPEEQTTYWPGVNPGPPGFEWSSNRCTILVEMTRVGMTDQQYYAAVARLEEKLDSMLPAWMTFSHFVSDESNGFYVGISGMGVVPL
ncbi:hypothetical protein WMF38_57395 [Sorangium sp. So ce118]